MVMEPCSSCASGKTKQRCISKKSERVQASKPGKWWYHDISTISNNDRVSCHKKQWHLQHDEYSRCSISNFYNTKDDFIETMCAFLCKPSETCMVVEYIHTDHSGENKNLV